MKTKILAGILLAIGLVVSIGVATAHGTNENNPDNTMMSMTNSEDGMDNMPMMSMMGAMPEEMIKAMEEVMSDETLRSEMLEHMKDCPMMQNSNSE